MKKLFCQAMVMIAIVFFVQKSSFAQSWSLTGNAGTSPGPNYVGTSDGTALSIKTHNKEAIRIDKNQNIGIGTISPAAKFEVHGADILINGLTMGVGAGAISTNTAIGYQALFSNTSGSENVAIGNSALHLNTNAFENTSVGSTSLFSNTTGVQNTAVGSAALYANTSGNSNTAIGNAALNYNTGSGNTATGSGALFLNSTGNANTADGQNALFFNTTGYYNTAVGYGALQNDSTGVSNTAIGYAAGFYVKGLFNATAIGADATVTASNCLVLGSGANVGIGVSAPTYQLQLSANSAAKPISSTWTVASDARLKTNVQDFKDGLDIVKQIHTVRFNYNGEAGLPKNEEGIGTIAQELQKIAPYMVNNWNYTDSLGKRTTYLGVDYHSLFFLLVNAVKELAAQNDSMCSQSKNMQEVIHNLQTELEESKSPANPKSLNEDGFAKLSFIGSDEIALLGQNIPNPFGNSTLIPFRIPKDCHDASIMIVNSSTAEVVSVLPVSCNEDHVQIDAGTLSSGTYEYSLYVNGLLIGTKSLVIAR